MTPGLPYARDCGDKEHEKNKTVPAFLPDSFPGRDGTDAWPGEECVAGAGQSQPQPPLHVPTAFLAVSDHQPEPILGGKVMRVQWP